MDSFVNTGKEWLLHALDHLCDIDRTKLLLIFWRSWYVRNEIVHHKPAPVMESLISFLRRYLDELIGIKLNSEMDPAKGKGYLSYNQHVGAATTPQQPISEARWVPPANGWVKLNADGSFVANDDDGVRETMVIMLMA